MVTEGIQKNQLDERLVKHMILTSLMSIKMKFGAEYGKLVICVDGEESWRKKIFPFYKENRKKEKDDSFIDWTTLYAAMDHFIIDLKTFFPYKVVEIDNAEADDVIATLAKINSTKEKILIISEDKDFHQLQKFKNIEQYGYRTKKEIKIDDPVKSLVEKVIKGDRGDGIPNIRSDDDTFVTEGKRQKPISAKMLEDWVNGVPEELRENYLRNDKLINFSHIPVTVEHAILKEYEKESVGTKRTMYNYFLQNNMKQLLGQIAKF